LPCNANCLTCIANSTNCITCPFSSSGGQLLLSNNLCVINCPSATFANTTANYCSPCHSFCSVCWGSTNFECSRCTNITIGMVTQIYYLAIGSTVCNISCPQGQYIDSNNPNYCRQCSSLCIYCLYNSHFCINNICPLGYFFYNNSCMPVCLQGTFPNISSSQCQICAVGCTSCTGSTLNDCSSCGTVSPPGTVYYLSHGTTSCVTACPSGQYPLTNNVCNLCNSRCTTCQGGSTSCTSCTTVNVVTMVYFYNLTCITLCPNGTYPDSINSLNNTCSNCNPYCSVCIGPSS
jgi:proprotein convertase subtilisin/kexin type 5